LLDFWTSAPHVNHKRAYHPHGNGAEYRFPQRLIRKELANVTTDKRAEETVQSGIVYACVQHVREATTGGQGEGNGDVDRRVKPRLARLAQVSKDDGDEQE